MTFNRPIMLAAAIAVGCLSLAGCNTTPGNVAHAPSKDAASLDQRANVAMHRLYEAVPGSRELVDRSAGVLIFPNVVGGSFVVGIEHGRGVLRVGGVDEGYYSTTAASIGFQAGGQSKAIIYVFNTQDALNKFRASKGWAVGADANVTAGRVGANGSIDSTTATAPVSSFVLSNVGLEGGVSLEGSRITPASAP